MAKKKMQVCTAEELKEVLEPHVGTGRYHQIVPMMRNFLVTDGIMALVEKANAHWLVHTIASLQLKDEVKEIPFQFWKLKVDNHYEANLYCYYSTYDLKLKTVLKEKIWITDFPVGEWQFYVGHWRENEENYTILCLPRED